MIYNGEAQRPVTHILTLTISSAWALKKMSKIKGFTRGRRLILVAYNEGMRNLLILAALCSLIATPFAKADEIYSSHAMTMYEAEIPKYGENFEHFDYVDPSAPKGGEIRLGAVGTFDSFNAFIPK